MLQRLEAKKKYLSMKGKILDGPLLFMLPAVLFVGGVTLFPMVHALWLSFLRFNLARPWVARVFVGWNNYLNLLHDPILLKALVVTAKFALATLTLQMAAGLLIALLLNLKVMGSHFFRVLFFVPMMTVPVATGLAFRLILNDGYGAANWFLKTVGLSPLYWLGNDLALFSVILAETWQWLPFSILIFSVALTAIPKTYYEAAAMEGASNWFAFTRITLPNLKWAIFIIAIFKLSDAIKAFDVIYIITGGGPGISTQTLALYLHKIGFVDFEMGYAAAFSFLLLAICLLIFLPLMHGLMQRKPQHV
jgi:multiple sugar transport system permease protein